MVPNTPALRKDEGPIGERLDAAAGPRLLGAGCYDTSISMPLQAGWWADTRSDVGYKRHPCDVNDPFIEMNPTGHCSPGKSCKG